MASTSFIFHHWCGWDLCLWWLEGYYRLGKECLWNQYPSPPILVEKDTFFDSNLCVISFKHIYRSYNQFSDQLSKVGHAAHVGFFLYERWVDGARVLEVSQRTIFCWHYGLGSVLMFFGYMWPIPLVFLLICILHNTLSLLSILVTI